MFHKVLLPLHAFLTRPTYHTLLNTGQTNWSIHLANYQLSSSISSTEKDRTNIQSSTIREPWCREMLRFLYPVIKKIQDSLLTHIRETLEHPIMRQAVPTVTLHSLQIIESHSVNAFSTGTLPHDLKTHHSGTSEQ